MPAPTTAELTEPIQFPADPGVPIWEERRAVPVVTVYGAPLAFTAMLAFMAGPLLVKAPLALGAAVLAVVLARARRRALIETFVVTDRFVTPVKPGGGRVALPTAAITALTVTRCAVRVPRRETPAALAGARPVRLGSPVPSRRRPWRLVRPHVPTGGPRRRRRGSSSASS